MDGWWNEDETFYPFEESPEEDDFSAGEMNPNPFRPISVADRFEQIEHTEHKLQPAPKAFTPPKPGQLYGQAYSRMAPLTPAKPFSQIQQGDLYGYSKPEELPTAPIPADPYPPQTNPFGASVGASPLGAATPDSLPTFTSRTVAMKRSELHSSTQQTSPVPIWSIDDDPVSVPSAQPDAASSPYPGFPPLPQSKPAPWQQSIQAAPAVMPASEPAKNALDWSLPAYPEANPDWKPSGDDAPTVPDFLQEMETAGPDTAKGETPEEPKSPMDKLNIPAYLRVQPLPKKKPRPVQEDAVQQEPAQHQSVQEKDQPAQETPAAEVPTAMPFRTGDAGASQPEKTAPEAAPQEDSLSPNAIFMRPRNLTSATSTPPDNEEAEQEKPAQEEAIQENPAQEDGPEIEQPVQAMEQPLPEPEAEPSAEPSPEEEIVSAMPEQPSAAAEAAPVVVTSGARRSRRSRMAQQPAASALVEAQDNAANKASSMPASLDGSTEEAPAPAPAEQPEQVAPVTEVSATETPAVLPAEAPAEPKQTEAAPADPASPEAPQPRKRRSRRSERMESANPTETPAEDHRPFVPTVGAEEPSEAPLTDRPAQNAAPVTDSSAAPAEPIATPVADFFLPIAEEEEPAPAAVPPLTGSTGLQPFPRLGALAPVATPVTEIDGEDDWRPFDPPAAIENPFGVNLPPIPNSPEQEWPLFGDQAADEPAPAKAAAFPPVDNPFGANLPPIPNGPEQEWLLFGDQAADEPAPAKDAAFPSVDNPFGTNLPPIPNSPEQEWSPFDSFAGGTSDGTPYSDSFPPVPEIKRAPIGAAPQPDTLFPLFDDEEPAIQPGSSAASDGDALFRDSESNLSLEESPLFGTSSFDAGQMPNPTRGKLAYEVVSEFDTLNRRKEAELKPEDALYPPLFETEPNPSQPDERTPGSKSASFPPIHHKAAKPLITKETMRTKPAKPPVNPVRLVLLLLAVAMALFCIFAGSKMLLGYVRNTEDWSRTHEDFINQHGVSMNQAGEMVNLPQDGSTFAPTSPPAQAATPQPASAHGQHTSAQQDTAVQVTPTPALRTKLHQYPDNPLRNEMASLSEIRKEYPEVIGRLVIPGVLDEWIVQRNNTYYLNHNYRGTSAEGGAVFMDVACTLDTPPENLHLRGSSTAAGKTFQPLWQYKTGGMAFINNAEMAQVTTLYEEVRYLLLAVIETSGDPSQPDYFNYTSYPTFATDEEMMNFVALARQHSLYNLPTDVMPGDRLLTLSTVTGADAGGGQSTNLVLIFRSVR